MKTAIITQARTSSTRLPKKVLKKIQDKTLLEYHLERAQQSGYPVIVATSTDPQDQPIANLCKEKDFYLFRGDLEDVLSRYYTCAMLYNLQTIVRITSDCPLIDGQLIDHALKKFTSHHVDYLSNTVKRTFPRGFDFEIMTMQALEKACINAKKRSEREHVTPYIWQSHPDDFKIEHFIQSPDESGYRITVDTLEDFSVVKILIEQYQADKMSYADIIKVLHKHPEISEINSQVIQKNL